MNPVLQELLLNVLVGTLAGGITNAVAVWMLFHPYEKTYGFHGAIPKNKARLAKSIGRTVGEKLLTPADLLDELSRAGFRETLNAKLAEFIGSALEQERGSLRSLLPAPLLAEVEKSLSDLGPAVGENVARYTATPEFEERVRAAVTRLRNEVGGMTVGQLLTPERRADLASQAAILATELIEETRDDEDRSATARIGDLLLRMAGTERTRGFVERTVADALGRAEHRRWSDVLDAIGEQSIVNWLIDAARSERATALAAEAASKGATALLDKPIGRPGRFLPADASVRLATFAGPALWQWMEAQLPRLVEQLDIQAMVERKVLGFSTARIEEIIRNVTERELRLIVRLGYLLGAVIGLITFGVGRIV
ncbi:MAG TPA: DUF445 family protein [Gemmatimonadaceae bacterium]|nr:DUF445 family protein [Gemmatimonadaceae bacterium]